MRCKKAGSLAAVGRIYQVLVLSPHVSALNGNRRGFGSLFPWRGGIYSNLETRKTSSTFTAVEKYRPRNTGKDAWLVAASDFLSLTRLR
ncbi:hypothetical protein PAXRUDRAFT_626315 [Paxillus rubicundulus Ve08.2h10]|uniref:Uncharacterized protein n=1 Tax=Paxillus rubicundulus Ve08.2h10 TaxID=930991 RepID=A0A0D0E3E4_9AGAM|nr:hypothetical protein PAXRUDRAFT_626315 [Paxillus rubicundulus Ve08.2h10]